MINIKGNLKATSFFDYWESFVSDYFQNVVTGDQIKGWTIPIGNFGNVSHARDYLPEPYWGWTPNSEVVLKAVFLNLNPGGGGECQKPSSNSQYIIEAKRSYKSMVQSFSDNDGYDTTKWFQRKRAVWISGILPETFFGTKVNELLCADLIPWHTPKYDAHTAKYVNDAKEQVLSNVICPIAEIASTAKLKDIVIAKGAHIEYLLKCFNDILGQPATYYNNTKTRRISVFHLNKTRFIVFVGGQGMSLPKGNIEFTEPGSMDGKKYSIKEIILK